MYELGNEADFCLNRTTAGTGGRTAAGRDELAAGNCEMAFVSYIITFILPVAIAFQPYSEYAKIEFCGKSVRNANRFDAVLMSSSKRSCKPADFSVITRRDISKFIIFSGISILPFSQPHTVNAQKPPPRPKVTSIPPECLQAGGCGMAGMEENLPKFKSVDQTPEILDPKSGQYSSGLKIQEISLGDEKGMAVAPERTVSLQVTQINEITDTIQLKVH